MSTGNESRVCEHQANVTIIDETLREVLDRSMSRVPVDDQYRLFRAQYDAGLREMVVGAAPRGTELLERICAEQDRGALADLRPIFHVPLSCWEAAYQDLARLPRAWIARTTVSFGMVEHRAEERLLEHAVEQLEVLGARRFRATVLNDFTDGCDQEGYARLTAQLERGISLGIQAFCVDDSLGQLTPADTAALCSRLVADFPELAFSLSCRDDRGAALSNQLASLRHGFQAVPGSLCGYGNRSGTTTLEALVSACRAVEIPLAEEPLALEALRANASLAGEIALARHASARGRYNELVHAMGSLYKGAPFRVVDITSLARPRRRLAS
jgi:2-isopropylmalate synthase